MTKVDLKLQKADLLQEKALLENVVLSAKGLCKSFGGQVVLDNISFELRRGEVVLLRGENGSGKTTLVNILTGNLEPDKGDLYININGKRETFKFPKRLLNELNPFDHFAPERLAWQGIGRAWQDIRLFPTMTVLENVSVAAQGLRGENPFYALFSPKARNQERLNQENAFEWLRKVGLGDRHDSSCDKLSLGQMKRVAIARAIRAGAKVLFLDEPLSGLDNKGVSEIMGYLKTFAREDSITLVIVEHVYNIPTILELADTVWSLSKGMLTVSKADDALCKGGNTERHGIHDPLDAIAVNLGSIKTEELSNGARLTIASNYKNTDTQVVLEVKGLVIKRGIRTVIDGFSFSLKRGEIAILEAPNGWGKSSLLDALSGIHPVESGKVVLKGEDITSIETHGRVKKGLAYLRSQMSVFNSLSVNEHKILANTNNGLFDGLLNSQSKGSFLSGGEKQKLLIDILPDADVYLLDEPMIGLDEKSIASLIDKLKAMLLDNKAMLITIPKRSKGGQLWQEN